MAEPALREQLSNYIAKRVNAQAEALVDSYSDCLGADWSEADKNRQLLDAGEKLGKLARKLPHQPYAELALKISSLLKLGNIEDKPSTKARQGIAQAISMMSKQIQAEEIISGKADGYFVQNILLALENDGLTSSIATAMKDADIKCSTLQFDKQVEPQSCLIIDIDYGGTEQGFELASKVADNENCEVIFFSSNLTPTLQTRLKSIRLGAKTLITGSLSARNIAQTINRAFGTELEIKPHVLVLDDSLSQLKYTENMLLANGFECSCISESKELLPLMQSTRPDLVLLDLYLADCTGLELAQVIKQHDEWQHIPIIFLSAEEDQAITNNAKQTVNAPFLTKPVKAQRLIREINTLLQRKKLKSI